MSRWSLFRRRKAQAPVEKKVVQVGERATLGLKVLPGWGGEFRTSLHKYYNGITFAKTEDYDTPLSGRVECEIEDAQVVSSELTDRRQQSIFTAIHPYEGQHIPLLDLDAHQVTVVPSSTPGHYHLYGHCAVDWETYERLLKALADCGIIEPGYAGVSLERKATHLRLPWVKKEAA